MVCYVYVLKSQATSRFYIGSTEDVERRIVEHNSGKSTSTRGRGPWQLYWQREFPDRVEAVRYERYLKSQKSRRVLEDLTR